MSHVAPTAAQSLMCPTAVETSASPVAPRRRSGRRTLVRVVGGIVIVGMLLAIFLPSLCRPANRVKCASNLREIGRAIALYAQANGGEYPPSLAVLAKQADLVPGMMVCPSSNDENASTNAAGFVADLTAAETNAIGHKHCLSYIYVGRGLNVATVSTDTIVAYEPPDNHKSRGTNVLFGDGHVEWLAGAPGEAWPPLQARQSSPR